MAGRGGGLDSLKTARMTRRRLPIGIQTFRKIREQDCYYVDKTAYVERLLREGTHYFLSRPRRFGKSLFLDTLKELFEGNEALFSGLYIHGRHDWSKRHPVVRLSFGGGSFTEPATLREDVMAQLDGLGRHSGVGVRYDTAPARFRHLLQALHEHAGQRVAVLVDEYDKPILDTLVEMPEVARANRDYLRGLYGVRPARTVDIRGLVQLLVDAGDAGQVDDRAEAHVLPDAADDEHRQPYLRIDHEVRRIQTGSSIQRTHHPRSGGHELDHQGAQERPRQEVREVEDRLNRALVPLRAELVQQDRQDDRRREPDEGGEHREADRVEHRPNERIGCQEHLVEVLEERGRPRASQDSLIDVEILEGESHPVDRQVVEDEQVDRAGDEQQQQGTVSVDVADPLRAAAARGLSGGRGDGLLGRRDGCHRHSGGSVLNTG